MINKIIKILNNGGVILYPTDTIWGIGCDATNSDAISKIYAIKRRKESKALISLVANKEQLSEYVSYIPKEAENKTPTTIIYDNIRGGLSKNLLAKDKTAGIRIVQDIFCRDLILTFGKPIVATSANISNEKYPKKYAEINESIINNVDYIVNLRKEDLMTSPSQILKVTKQSIQIIR